MRFKAFFISLTLFLFYWQIGNGSPIHEKNREIFAEIINKHLEEQKDLTPLFCNIDLIGKEALQSGLDLSCYTYRVDSETQALRYATFPLWDGKEGCGIIFLLYVWPSQEEALKCCNKDTRYKTNIHSHPIPCAYTVVLGEITELQYQRLNFCDKSIQFCGKEVFHLGEKSVDLNQRPFIHQLLFEGEGRAPAITLHAYGCSSLESFSRILKATYDQHVYPEGYVEP